MHPNQPDEGAVFAMTNAADGNQILAYRRAADGQLALIDRVATEGRGIGGNLTASIDPLGSQNSLILSQDHRLLFAVNAGSDEISAFRVEGASLIRTATVPSGGRFPVSLTQHGDRLFVLNAADDGSIAGFRIGEDGSLTALAESVRSLGLGDTYPPSIPRSPSIVRFSPDGRHLVITHTGSGTLLVFAVNEGGCPASEPQVHRSAGRGPFGASFSDGGTLVVAEVAGTLSSYRLDEDGTPRPISAAVANGQSATCWVVANGRHAVTANTGSGTLTSYRLEDDGSATLVSADGVSARLPGGAAPTDLALAAGGRYLYSVNAGNGTVAAFQLLEDGALETLQVTNGLPTAGAQGIAGY